MPFVKLTISLILEYHLCIDITIYQFMIVLVQKMSMFYF